MSSTQFSDFGFSEPIERAILETGYTQPTPIQQAAIPHLLLGKDLLGCAQTGTGKTAAFALPILNRLGEQSHAAQAKHARVLILTPTRELAIQIYDSFRTYGKYTKLSMAVVYGGVGQVPQAKAVSRGVDILVATPGRLLDLINQKLLSLRALEIFVLDEADRMLDMGFIHDIRKVIAMLPEKRQNLFFSATMPTDIKKLSETILRNPVSVEVAPVSSTAERIAQEVMYVDRNQKKSLLKHVLSDDRFKRVIVFTRTKRGANQVSEALAQNGVISEAIHGNKSQGARQRALENFRAGKTRVLVATDIAARGIDIDEISHVINFEVPNIAESYVHRIGRTARAGADGIAISFCDAEERSFIKDIEKLIGQSIPVNREQPYHSDAVEGARIMSKGKAKAAIESGQRSGGQARGRSPRRSQGAGRSGGSTGQAAASASGRSGNRRASQGVRKDAAPVGRQGAKPESRTDHRPAAKPGAATAPSARSSGEAPRHNARSASRPGSSRQSATAGAANADRDRRPRSHADSNGPSKPAPATSRPSPKSASDEKSGGVGKKVTGFVRNVFGRKK